MSILHELMGCCLRTSVSRAVGGEPRRTGKTRCVLSFLILWITAAFAGCGGTVEQAKEQQKEKQQVIQEKMKEFMQQKAQSSRARR